MNQNKSCDITEILEIKKSIYFSGILELLSQHRFTTIAIAYHYLRNKNIKTTFKTTSRKIKQLLKKGIIKNLGSGIYTLTEKGRALVECIYSMG